MNLKGLIILGVTLLVALASYFPIKSVTDREARRTALSQAKASEAAGDIDLALRQIQGYVANWPRDLPGLEYQANLLTQTAGSAFQYLAAAQANDKVLRLDPTNPARQETRRRLVRLYVKYSDDLRAYAASQKQRGAEASELRYNTATNLARQLIAQGATDAEAHRLLAMSLEGSVVMGDSKSLDEATAEFRKAIELEPTDTVAPERLARLQLLQKKDPAAAEATMDALLAANPNSVPVRLTRYRYSTQIKNPAKSLAEIEAASVLAPHDLEVQSVAASDAMQRLDFDGARRHIAAIPSNEANELKLRTLRGLLELSEKNPNEAIEEWRKGLISVGGTDIDLTWRLADTLIRLGRLNEARPLIAQFQRLGGEKNASLSRYLRAVYDQRSGHPRSAIKELTRIADQIDVALQPDVFLTLGRCYEALEEELPASLAYQKAASLAPTATEPRRAIARLMAARAPADAMSEMERALAQNPNDLALVVEVGRLRLRQQALLPEADRRWEGVGTLVDEARKLAPNDLAVQTFQADFLAASGRLKEAADMLRQAVTGPNKHKPEIWVTYAGALDRLNQRQEALKVLEQGSAPQAAGDHSMFRIARAKILTGLSQAQAAREVLAKDRDKIPKPEQPELAHALGELCRELGDLKGAREALADWARQVPDQSEPALTLLSFAQTYNDDEAAKLGLEALRTLSAEQEPFGLAARVLELLRIDRLRADSAPLAAPTDPAELKRLDEADRLVAKLVEEAPQLSIVPMLQGMVLERRGQPDKAIEAYRRSVKDGTLSPGLSRLVELLSRRERYDEIAQLKAKIEGQAGKDGKSSLITSFDQITAAVALKLGDTQRAERSVAEMVEAQPNNLTARANQARLLSTLGKNREAEATLRQLTLRQPAEPSSWVALVAFRVQHPDLGDMNKLLDDVRTGYKGAHPELLMARCVWIAGDMTAAAKQFTAAVERNGDDLTTLRDAIEFDEANGRTDDAVVKLRRVLKIDPKATWASRTLAVNLTTKPERASWQQAWDLIKPGAPGYGDEPQDRLIRATILARSPESAQREQAPAALAALANDLPASSPVAIEARVRLAQALLESNQAVEAARMIAPVADDMDRPNAAALALSIEALVRSRELATASKQLDRLMALEPKSPRSVASKAWVAQGQGKSAEAYSLIEAAYTEAEQSPTGEVVALAFQDLLTKFGNVEGALALAQRIAIKWPRDAYILAKAQLNADQTAAAIQSCRTALEAGEVNEALRIAISIAIEHRDDVKVLREIDTLAAAALKQMPNAPEILVFVATLRHLQARYDEEIGMYRLALENAPVSFLFLNNMAWTLCEGLQRPDEALERIDDLIRRDGQAPQFLDTRGVILFRLKRSSEAIADLEQSIAGYSSATTYFHLARAFRAENKREEYHRVRDMARKLNLDVATLDPTDKTDVSAVMNGD